MDKKVYGALVLVLALVASLIIYSVVPVYATSEPELPDPLSVIEENPAINMGPGSPVVVFPGERFIVVLREDYSDVDVSSGYMFTVKLVEGSLTLYNYTLSIETINSTAYRASIPIEAEPGLYDLVLVGSKKLVIERSVWVIKGVKDVISIVHMSDLHFGTGTPDVLQGAYKRFTGHILAQLLRPDVVFRTGDEADTQAEPQYRESRIFRYMFLYPIPVFLIPGNHDWPNDNYVRFYGSPYWYRVIGGKILVLSINTRGEEGYPDWPQIARVEEILRKYREVPIKIVLMHHPLFYWQGEVHATYNSPIIDDPHENPNSPISYYWGGNLSMARYFIKLCEDYNITLVFAGHIHRDQYVVFHSTRTGVKTYFITTTTLAHGTPTYNGFQFVEINLTKLELSFPYAPPTFIGFKNSTQKVARNSIFNTLPAWYGRYLVGKHAYVFELISTLYFNVSNTILLALPWSGDLKGVHVESKGLANVFVKNYLVIDGYLYIALHVEIASESSITIVIYNEYDTEQPKVMFKMSLPRVPTLGRQNKLYFDIVDDEWGVRSVSAKIIYMEKEHDIDIEPYADSTYIVSISGYTGEEPKTLTLIITVTDYANNTVAVWFSITLYPPGYKPTATPITATYTSSAKTASTSPTTTPTTTETETRPTITESLPTTTPVATSSPTTTSVTTLTTPTQTQTPTRFTPTAPESTSPRESPMPVSYTHLTLPTN